MNAYQLKPWTQIVIPHQDIREGNLDNAVFAASLSAVVRNDRNCPQVYKDARSFFDATYLTKELKQLFTDVLKGLGGQGGDRVLQLRTPFGGGKTHSLVSLYHLVQHRQELGGIPELDSLPNVDDYVKQLMEKSFIPNPKREFIHSLRGKYKGCLSSSDEFSRQKTKGGCLKP